MSSEISNVNSSVINSVKCTFKMTAIKSRQYLIVKYVKDITK